RGELERVDLEPRLAARRTYPAKAKRIASGVHEDADATHARHELPKGSEALLPQLFGDARHAGDVASRAAEARNKAGLDRIRSEFRGHDRNGRRRLLGSESRRVPHRNDHVDLHAHEL